MPDVKNIAFMHPQIKRRDPEINLVLYFVFLGRKYRNLSLCADFRPIKPSTEKMLFIPRWLPKGLADVVGRSLNVVNNEAITFLWLS